MSPLGKTALCCLLRRFGAVVGLGSVFLGLPAGCLAGDGDPAATDNVGLGYLTAPSQSPGHLLRPSSLFVIPGAGPAGSTRIDCDIHWANVWNYEPHEYLIDGEWIRSNLRLTYAVDDALAAGIALPIIGRTGGFADPLIEDFHKAFKIGNAHRDEFPQNQTSVSLYSDGVNHTIVQGDSWGIGDVSGFLSYRIVDGSWIVPAITLQGEVSLPSGDKDELRGIGAPEYSLGAVASKLLGSSPFILFGGVGSEYSPADQIAGIDIYRMEWSGLGGIAYRYSPSLSLITQYLVSSPVAKEGFAFSKPCHEVSAGVKWRISAQATLEFAVVENVAIFENSSDIGVNFCFGRSL